MRLERLCRIEIVVIATAPPERRAFSALESGEIDSARSKRLELFNWVVAADYADQLNRREQACSGGEERRRSAEDVVSFSERSFYRVECNRADYKNGH
jgi:hypothetical protein